MRFHGDHTVDDADARRLLTCVPGISQEVSEETLNLGYGWVYYALVRLLRPSHVLVIGSGYGFSPGVIAKALHDNGDGGHVSFVDPSVSPGESADGGLFTVYGQGNWSTPDQVEERFSDCLQLGQYVTHYKLTDREFFEAWETLNLERPEIVLIDGAHDYDHVLLDAVEGSKILKIPGYILLHDSTHFANRLNLFGVAGVVEQIREAARGDTEVLTFPGEAGLTIIRVTDPGGLAGLALAPPTPWGWILFGISAGLVGLGVVVGKWIWKTR